MRLREKLRHREVDYTPESGRARQSMSHPRSLGRLQDSACPRWAVPVGTSGLVDSKFMTPACSDLCSADAHFRGCSEALTFKGATWPDVWDNASVMSGFCT